MDNNGAAVMPEQLPSPRLGARVGYWLIHVVVGLLVGFLIIIVPMFGPWLIVPWFLVVVFATRRDGSRAKAFAIQFVTIAIVVLCAVYAPVKTVDEVLARTVQLPATLMQLTEMDEQHRLEHDSSWLPRFIHIETTPEIESQLIEFPAQELTLREFVDAIESQSPLRHRFRHCGNGYTVLYGDDCCFGLSIREPR